MNKQLWARCLILVLALLIARFAIEHFAPSALDALQGVVFIAAIVTLVWRGSHILPRIAALLAMLGGVVGASYAYSWLHPISEQSRVVYVMRLSGDATGGTSRILREAIEQQDSSLARRFYREIEVNDKAPQELAKVFDLAQGESGVVWGNTQLVRYSPSPRAPLKLKSIPYSSPGSFSFEPRLNISSRLAEAQLVMEVPVIGMSFQPANATGAFIGKLTLASRVSGEARELQLEDAGRMTERWRSSEHKAYPFFLMGTDLVVRYIEGGAQEIGFLTCAERDFQTALELLVTGGTPQLMAATRNNLAITHGLMLEDQGLSLNQIKSEFQLAKRLQGRKDPYRMGGNSPRIAAQNIDAIFGESKSKKVRHHKPHRTKQQGQKHATKHT